jgi:hypothetical protein
MTALPKPLRSERKRGVIDTSTLPLAKQHVARDAEYKAYVRSHPCAIKGRAGHRCEGPVESAHIRTAGLGLKSSDYATIPLCVKAHEYTQHQIGWGEFMSRYDLNPWHVAFHLLEAWVRRTARG